MLMTREFVEQPSLSDHHVGRRLLFLLPFPPRLGAMHGGGRVMAQLLFELAARHRVALLYLRAASERPIDEVLRQRCELTEEVIRPEIIWSEAARWLDRWPSLAMVRYGKPPRVIEMAVSAYGERLRRLVCAWQPDVVQVEYHLMGQYLDALDGCPAPRVLVEYDPGVQAAADKWRLEHGLTKLKSLVELLLWYRFERAILARVHAVVVFTERDRQVISRLAQQTPVFRIPPGTLLPERPLNPAGSSPLSLLFVGNFKHPPNVDAARRLVNSIFPEVQAQRPDVRLYIVGDQPPSEIRNKASDTVIVTGRVPDVDPYLDMAAIVVIPLRQGGGVRVKTLEALSAGKAILASPLAVAGLNVTDGEQVILAEDNRQFAEIILHLLADPARRIDLANRARAWAVTHLSWDKPVRQYEQLYDDLLGGTCDSRCQN